MAGLREATGRHPHYPRPLALVSSLTAASEEFAALWSAHTAYGKTGAAKELTHPAVGPLPLARQPRRPGAGPARRPADVLRAYPREAENGRTRRFGPYYAGRVCVYFLFL